MLERKDAITNEVLEPITFVLAYLTVFKSLEISYIHTLRHMIKPRSCCIYEMRGKIYNRNYRIFKFRCN